MAGSSFTPTAGQQGAGSIGKYTSALIVLTSLFFMWGFITCMNDILIPFLKKMFDLSRVQSMGVQFAFFMAYFLGSLVYFAISSVSGDPINKIGYKSGLLMGLVIAAGGCLMFYPAAEIRSYPLFLAALFVVAIGFTMLQIAANPYVAILGKPETASSRLNLSQAFNSFGTAIAPIIGGFLVFHFFARNGQPLLDKAGEAILTDSGTPMSIVGVQIPYLAFAGIFLLLAVLIAFTRLPRFKNEEHLGGGTGALKHPHLIFGMIAIFMYVGAEVSIGSCLINYMHELTGMVEMEAKSYLSLYWGGAMIGRFLGAISLGSIKNKARKTALMLLTATGTFLILYLIILLERPESFPFSKVWPYLLFIAANLVGFRLGRSLPGRTLFVFATVNVGLLIFTTLSSGMSAIWAVLGIGLFNSIMWSNIFTLAIKNLGKYTSQGSSLLVMMILGGAILPLLQGKMGDYLGGYHYSFFIPALAYVYLAFYGARGHKAGLQAVTENNSDG